VALAERLPLPTASFDLVTGVGVMEHFLDDHEATREVWRVLKPGGYYTTLIHVDLSFRERVLQKLSEYVVPRFRPVSLIKWMSSKMVRPIRQPIQRRYTVESARQCLEECAFTMIRVMSKKTDPGMLVIGPHVVIYVARK
jgi:ubiquinone/menaquinone biosynthesis C-methylase UbiE